MTVAVEIEMSGSQTHPNAGKEVQKLVIDQTQVPELTKVRVNGIDMGPYVMTFTNADGETVFTEDPIEANASD